MANDKQPITIKKYPNRRLYNTGTSTYVTLEDLARMVKEGEDFLVYDAKSGEDITRPVLGQIIFEQEGKDGQALLPIAFLRQLIRFYGDSMQMLVPSYLEYSFNRFVGEQQKLREQITTAFGAPAMPGTQMLSVMEDHARANLAMFTQALAMMNPFAGGLPAGTTGPAPEVRPGDDKPASPDLEELKNQIAAMQRQIEGLARKG